MWLSIHQFARLVKSALIYHYLFNGWVLGPSPIIIFAGLGPNSSTKDKVGIITDKD